MNPDAAEMLSELTVTAPKRGPAKMRYSHVAMVDAIVQNPALRQNDLAVMFGRTPAWISTIMQTDAFRALLEERREEIIDPELRATVKERFEALVTRSLQVLQEKLSKPDVDHIPDNLALRAAELGAKSLGFGVPQAPSNPQPLGDGLTHLAARLLSLQRAVRGDVTDVQEIPNEASSPRGPATPSATDPSAA